MRVAAEGVRSGMTERTPGYKVQATQLPADVSGIPRYVRASNSSFMPAREDERAATMQSKMGMGMVSPQVETQSFRTYNDVYGID